MKKILMIVSPALAFLFAFSASAQNTARLPVTCNPESSQCVTATPVVNPDGTNIGGGGGGSVPTGTAGSPNASVLTVQGITGGTPQRITGIGQTTSATSQSVVPASDSAAFPISASSLPLPTGAATSANQATQITAEQAIQANQTNGTQTSQGLGKVVSQGFDASGPLTVGSRQNFIVNQYGQQVVSATVADTAGNGKAANLAKVWTENAGSGVLETLGTLYNGATLDMPPGNATGGAFVQGSSAAAAALTGNGIRNFCAITTAAPTYTTATGNDLSCNTSGGLRVDGSGVTQPISSTTLTTISGQLSSARGIQTSANSMSVAPSSDGVFATQQGLGATALGGATATTVLASTGNTFKATLGNIASLNVVNNTVAGFIAVTDLTSVPTSGTAITAAQLKYCFPVPASAGFDKVWQVPLNLASGITVLFSTSCTTYTPTGTAPVSISVQYK